MAVQLVDWFGDGTVMVLDLALACCALETEAARPDAALAVTEFPQGAKLVVTISGTLTNALAPSITKTIAELPAKPVVVAFGACASLGGPYWDSYSVVKGVDQLVPVDHFIAGCPPPPEALTVLLDEVRRA